jgi:L-aminopeptidase/D-esterase-like protein
MPHAGGAIRRRRPVACAASPLLANRGALEAANRVPFVQAIQWTVLAVFAANAGAAVRLRVRDTARYQTLGRVVVYEG